MGEQIAGLVGVAAVFGTAMLMMMWMWRRMRKVNARAAETRRDMTPPTDKYDVFDPATGSYRPETSVSEELAERGARARQSGSVFEPGA